MYQEFEALSKLLHPGTHPQDDKNEEGKHPPGPAALGPAGRRADVQIAPPRSSRRSAQPPAPVIEEDNVGREAPNYEFIYKQAVATTEAFLGMGGKHPGSHCCEDMVIRLQLPFVQTLAELDLDLQEDKLLLRSPQYYLALDLPHQVSEQHSKALWDSKKRQLEVSMRIVPSDFQPDLA